MKPVPKDCISCGRRFNSMKEYDEYTAHQSQPRFYDTDRQNWQPSSPLGILYFLHCLCGNTLAHDISNIEVKTMLKLQEWINGEGQRRDIFTSELLNDLRPKMATQILSEA